jgi:hypothetical protein
VACMLRFHIAMYVKRLQMSQRATPAQLQRGKYPGSRISISFQNRPESNGFLHSLALALTHSLTHSLSHSHSLSLTPSLTLSLSLSLSLSHSLTHSPSLSHSLTLSLSLTHSLSHSHYQQLDRSSNYNSHTHTFLEARGLTIRST